MLFRILALLFLNVVLARSIDFEVMEFNQKLGKFDKAYLSFRNAYCSIPEGAIGEVPCIMADTFDYAAWKKAREAAKKFFRLEEK